MWTEYARLMGVRVIGYSRAGLGAVFSAKSLHEFLNSCEGYQGFSLYRVRKLLKYWSEARWVVRFGNQYYFTNSAAWELLGE